jgi:antitoxin YefM
MAAVTATQARRDFFGMIQRVADGDGPVEVVSKHGNVMVVSAAEYESLIETAYLLSNPANADRLRRSLADARAGRVEAHELPQS